MTGCWIADHGEPRLFCRSVMSVLPANGTIESPLTSRLRTCYRAHASERVLMRKEPTMNALRQTATKTTVRVICGTFGIDEPSALIDLGRGAGFRATSAAMHRLAARVEELSTNARWIVQTRADDRYEQRGRVYLELARGNPAEVERGLAVLRAAASGESAI